MPIVWNAGYVVDAQSVYLIGNNAYYFQADGLDLSPFLFGFQPHTMYIAFRPDDVTGLQCPISHGQSNSANADRFCMELNGSDFTNIHENDRSTSAGTITANTWHRGVLTVDPLTNDRKQAFNSGAVNTYSSSAVSFARDANTRLVIGNFPDSSLGQNFQGRLALPTIWRGVLTDAEMTALGMGAHPLSIRPDALLHCWNLVTLEDYVGGVRLRRNGGNPIHPAGRAPVRLHIGDGTGFLPAAAGGGATTDVPLTTFSVSPQAPTTLRSLISNVPTL